MNAELDLIPIGNLIDRYGVARSNIYNRLSGLGIEPEKQGGKAYINADQLALMDALNQHLKGGGTIADFQGQLSYRTGRSEKSYKTQDNLNSLEVTEQPALIATLMSAIAAFQPQQKDPLANLETLERVAEKGWLLSTSQLAPLVGVKTPTGKQFTRYGFTFTRAGKNGAESAWKVTKG
jgi:hypothetical protein